MIDLGIRAHDVKCTTADELSSSIHDLGFAGVQLVLKKALSKDVSQISPEIIREAFKDPYVMMLGAYFNPVHPDLSIQHIGIDLFRKHIAFAAKTGIRYVGSETGSLMGSPWGYMPENHGSAPLETVIAIFSDLVRDAQRHNVFVAIEGAYAHVAFSPERIRTILDRISSPNLKVTIDLFNFLNLENHTRHLEIFDRCLELFKDDIAIIHLKDYVVAGNTLKTVGLGEGLMAYQDLIPKIKSSLPDVHLIFEGVTGDSIPKSMTYIKTLLERT